MARTATKATLKNIVTNALDKMATTTTRYELVSFKTKKAEELGEQLVYIYTEENMVRMFKSREVKMASKQEYIYSITTGELMDKNFKTI